MTRCYGNDFVIIQLWELSLLMITVEWVNENMKDVCLAHLKCVHTYKGRRGIFNTFSNQPKGDEYLTFGDGFMM